jgi:hypothetical protein
MKRTTFLKLISFLFCIFPCAYALLAPAGAGATTVLKLSLQDLVGKSDAIIVGIVLGKEYGTSGSLAITKNMVQVEQCLGGCDRLGGGSLEIVTLGGRKNGVAVHVFGEASFEVGEKFVSFLRLQGGRWRVVGMAQGKLKMEKDPESGCEIVLPPGKVNLVRLEGWVLVGDEPFMTSPVPAEDFIRSVLEEVGKKESHEP